MFEIKSISINEFDCSFENKKTSYVNFQQKTIHKSVDISSYKKLMNLFNNSTNHFIRRHSLKEEELIEYQGELIKHKDSFDYRGRQVDHNYPQIIDSIYVTYKLNEEKLKNIYGEGICDLYQHIKDIELLRSFSFYSEPILISKISQQRIQHTDIIDFQYRASVNSLLGYNIYLLTDLRNIFNSEYFNSFNFIHINGKRYVVEKKYSDNIVKQKNFFNIFKETSISDFLIDLIKDLKYTDFLPEIILITNIDDFGFNLKNIPVCSEYSNTLIELTRDSSYYSHFLRDEKRESVREEVKEEITNDITKEINNNLKDVIYPIFGDLEFEINFIELDKFSISLIREEKLPPRTKLERVFEALHETHTKTNDIRKTTYDIDTLNTDSEFFIYLIFFNFFLQKQVRDSVIIYDDNLVRLRNVFCESFVNFLGKNESSIWYILTNNESFIPYKNLNSYSNVYEDDYYIPLAEGESFDRFFNKTFLNDVLDQVGNIVFVNSKKVCSILNKIFLKFIRTDLMFVCLDDTKNQIAYNYFIKNGLKEPLFLRLYDQNNLDFKFWYDKQRIAEFEFIEQGGVDECPNSIELFSLKKIETIVGSYYEEDKNTMIEIKDIYVFSFLDLLPNDFINLKLNEYLNIDEGYNLFPKGINVYFYFSRWILYSKNSNREDNTIDVQISSGYENEDYIEGYIYELNDDLEKQIRLKIKLTDYSYVLPEDFFYLPTDFDLKSFRDFLLDEYCKIVIDDFVRGDNKLMIEFINALNIEIESIRT